jgi:putative transposase
MSDLYQSLSHSKWDCKYHVVFVPKRRRKVLFGKARSHLGEIFRALARQKECRILEGHLMPDHVPMCIAIPPKHPVASGSRVSQGEECYRHGPTVRQREKFHGRAFLGPWLCGVHGRV